jgi:hypothetical protein
MPHHQDPHCSLSKDDVFLTTDKKCMTMHILLLSLSPHTHTHTHLMQGLPSCLDIKNKICDPRFSSSSERIALLRHRKDEMQFVEEGKREKDMEYEKAPFGKTEKVYLTRLISVACLLLLGLLTSFRVPQKPQRLA